MGRRGGKDSRTALLLFGTREINGCRRAKSSGYVGFKRRKMTRPGQDGRMRELGLEAAGFAAP